MSNSVAQETTQVEKLLTDSPERKQNKTCLCESEIDRQVKNLVKDKFIG